MIEIIKRLTKLANHFDSKGLAKEADHLDKVIKKIAHEFYEEESECGEDIGEELSYLKHLSDMYEKAKNEDDDDEEDDARDLVNT